MTTVDNLGYSCRVRVVLALIVVGLLGFSEIPDACAQANLTVSGSVKVPHPDSVDPAEVVLNIKAWAEQTALVQSTGIDELAMRAAPLRARRVLQVVSLPDPPGYLVAELEDATGRAIANVAMTRPGQIMAVEDLRGEVVRHPLDLDVASSLVRTHRKTEPTKAEYQYFRNGAEFGSAFRPLVAVETAAGTLYLDSRRRVYADESDPIVRDFGETPVPRGDRADATPKLIDIADW